MELMHERRRRQEMGRVLADVQQECSRPSVVPMLAAVINSMFGDSPGTRVGID